MKPTPVGLVWGRFLEWWYLQQVVVDEVVVADTALASVVQPVAHAARAVVVAGQVATDRVWFALESPDATFVYVLTHTCKKHRRVSIACHCHSCMTSLATSKSCRWTMDLWGCCRQVICFFTDLRHFDMGSLLSSSSSSVFIMTTDKTQMKLQYSIKNKVCVD